MAIGLTSTDSKLLFGTGAILLLLSILIGTIGVPDEQKEAVEVPSTYSAKPSGAAAAYALLQELHYPVERWEEPPAGLLRVDPRAILVLAEPVQIPSAGERAYLRRFVQNGGRVLFCGGSLPSFFSDASLAAGPHRKTPAELPPDLPSPFTRGVRKLAIAPLWFWKTHRPDQIALFGGEGDPVAVIWHLGLGEVLWWSAASPLTNRGIGQADNLTVFLDAVSAGTQSPRPIYWDEYFHGSRGTLWSYVERTPLKWALLQCLFLFGAVLFAFSRRSGPTVIPRRVSRLSPLEFVDTLGGLYQRAGVTSVATGTAYRHLRFTLSRRLLLPSTTPDAALAEAAAQRLGWDREKFAVALARAESSQHRNLRPHDALALVKNIGYYLHRLADRRPTTETK